MCLGETWRGDMVSASSMGAREEVTVDLRHGGTARVFIERYIAYIKCVECSVGITSDAEKQYLGPSARCSTSSGLPNSQWEGC